MRILFILLLALITLQVNAQKIIGSTTTAGGDLQGSYPAPTIKNLSITWPKLSAAVKDSIRQAKRDTAVRVPTGQNYALEDILYPRQRYNNVDIFVKATAGNDNTAVFFPAASYEYSQTTYRVFSTATNFLFFPSGGYLQGNIINKSANALENGEVGTIRAIKDSLSNYQWVVTTAKDTLVTSAGITSLTNHVVATGPGAASAVIQSNVITSSMIVDGTIALADMGTNSVNSAKIVDASIALGDMASNSVNGSKVVDYSLTGADLDYLTLRAGDASNAILKFSNGTDKTSVTGGEWLFDGNRLGFAISTTKKRVPLTNDVAPSAGQLPIGNGTDYTVAALTAGSNISITNGSGSVTIATYPKRDTVIYLTNVDYNLGTALTSAEVAARHNKIVINSYLSAAAGSDNQLTMPVPGVNYELCEIQYYAYDESGDADDATIAFGTNLGALGDGTYTTSYALVPGQMVTIRCMKDAKDSNNYKWFFW